jgi:protoporphyrinogen oxidase
MVLVYLVLGTWRLTPYDAHYLPEAWTPVTRLSEPKNYRDAPRTDPADHTVVCAEIPCDQGDSRWRAGRGALADLVRSVLTVTGLPHAPVDDVEVVRLPSAYPVYGHGFAERVATIEGWLASQPGVMTFGRQGLFVHDNTHHAMAMAWAAVDALADGSRPDAEAWRHARAGFRDHVVED